MTSDDPKRNFRNGVEMPALGLGVYQSGPDETLHAVSTA
jgi:diketogulonate reductase-like aldo/keto reductase